MEVGYLLEAVSDGKQRRILVQVAHECEAGRCSWTSDIVVNIFVHFGWRRSVCVANPIRYSRTTLSYDTPPPLLGEHTDEVLSHLLGKSVGELAELREKKII